MTGFGHNIHGFGVLGAGPSFDKYSLMVWGANSNGELGLGNTTNYSSPVQVGGAVEIWAKVAVDTDAASWADPATAAIKADGTLWTWGRNRYGILGHGNTTSYSSPVQVGTLKDWLTISVSSHHMMALKTDYTLWGWGKNTSGCIGNGNTTNLSSPVQIGSLTDWRQAEADSQGSTGAIKADNTLWTWGVKSSGRLGHNNNVAYSSPKQVGSLTDWSFISCAGGWMHAIKTDGTLWGWGQGGGGGLVGDGTETDRSSPVQIGALTTWAKISTSGGLSMGVASNGTLWTWGSGYFGRLGHGNSTFYSSPVQVGSLTDWSVPTAGGQTTGALKTDGTIWTWGHGGYGRLGTGATSNRSSPVQVGSLTTWTFFSVGGSLVVGLIPE